jgi:beta-glucanase (GH16 family)
LGTTEARIVCRSVGTGGSSTGKAFWDTLAVERLQTINNPDYNGDLIVNLLDFVKLAAVWHQVSSVYNLRGSDSIDQEDLAVFADAWLTAIPVYPGYELVWSDEFSGTQINAANWTHQVMGDGGNNESQYYTARPVNSRVENGVLIIQANKEDYFAEGRTFHYTSARLRTAGKQDFLYGKLEARIKIPKGQGIWPAFWMMPTDNIYGGWAASGEIDIMESIGQADAIYGTLHYGGSWPNNTSAGGSYSNGQTDYSQDFHVYGIEWEPNVFRWYLDGQLYYTRTSWWSSGGAYPAPFNQRFHFLLNVAVGGNWPGYPDATTIFPQQMQVDYVRVYQKIAP